MREHTDLVESLRRHEHNSSLFRLAADEIERLRNVCSEAYQMAGALDAPEKALDTLIAAASGEPLPHETFLPVAPRAALSLQQITATLTAWQTAMQDCEQQMDGLAELIGTSPESPLQAAVYRLMGAHTQATAEAIGWDADTLVAWWTEHNFGERPMQIGLAGEPLRSLDSIEALAQCIADDLERAQ